MKLNILKFIGFFVLVAFFASCEQEAFEEYSSVPAGAAPTLTVTIDSNTDSAMVVSYSINVPGRVTLAIAPASVDTPSFTELEQRAVEEEGVQISYLKHDTEAGNGTVTYTGLMPYTQYRMFAIAHNTDGVASEMIITDFSRTQDYDAPTLNLDEGVSPAIASAAEQDIDFSIDLTFDEPVVLATDFDIQIGYRDAETKVINWVAVVEDSISISGNVLSIKQMQTLLNGQYVFLTIADGAITDRNGNEYEGVTSGIISDELAGIFWRVAWENKSELEVLPADDVFVTDPSSFQVIKLVYPYNLSTKGLDDYEPSMIKVRYYDAELEENYNIPVEDIVIDEDTLEISIPKAGAYGSFVTLSIEEGTVWDVYGNDIAAVDFGDYEWFISYGYTRDMIIGTYTVDGTSNWAGYDESFDVTIAVDPDNDDQIIATGIYYSDVEVVGVFNGDLATLTFNIPENPLGGNWIELGDLWGDGASNSLEVYQNDHFVCHIDASGNMTTDTEYLWGSYWYLDSENEGWNNIFVASTWTKTAKAAKSVSADLRNLKIKREL